MWKRIDDEIPPLGAAVLLCAKHEDGRWRFMAIPEWSEEDSRTCPRKVGVFWQLIRKPDEPEL